MAAGDKPTDDDGPTPDDESPPIVPPTAPTGANPAADTPPTDTDAQDTDAPVPLDPVTAAAKAEAPIAATNAAAAAAADAANVAAPAAAAAAPVAAAAATTAAEAAAPAAAAAVAPAAAAIAAANALNNGAPDSPPPLTNIDLSNPALDNNLAAVDVKLTQGKAKTEAAGGYVVEQARGAPTTQPYDPDQSRDTTRQTITLWLIGLLCAIVVLAFVALFARGAANGFTAPSFFDDLKKVLDVLVGPVITLLASAVGFYFGSKQNDSSASNTKT